MFMLEILFLLIGFTVFTYIIYNNKGKRYLQNEIVHRDKAYITLIETVPISIIIYSDNNIIYGNKFALGELVIDDTERIINQPIKKFIHPDDYHQLKQKINNLIGNKDMEQMEIKFIKSDGYIIHAEVRANIIEFKDKTAVMIIFKNITDRKRREKHIEHLAYHDSLTGLPNRNQLKNVFQDLKKISDIVGVLYLDLDKFKSVNDNLGHYAGDKVLKIIAKRLEYCLKDTDMAVRFGGDEFIVIVSARNKSDVIQIAEKLLESISNSIIIEKQTVNVLVSIGISFYPFDGQELRELIEYADIAMYNAKYSKNKSIVVAS